ncbi:MAG TPA: c-type cytochrome [Candidatus Omnitrophota bacterium]|nr:c-type cytochrome [Candidatus Omnitrophota bacterium]
MNKKIVFILCIFNILIFSRAQGQEDPKSTPQAIDSQMIDQCMSFQHGIMVRCLRTGIETFEEDEKTNLFLSKDLDESLKWEAPEEALEETSPFPADAASQEQGKIIYGQHCLPCHGVSGRGDGPMAQYLGKRLADLNKSSLKEATDGALMWKITEGGWPMPAFSAGDALSREDIWHAINYIRALSQIK